MIYKTLWISCALVGSGNGLMFLADPSISSGTALAVCGLACWITFNEAWK